MKPPIFFHSFRLLTVLLCSLSPIWGDEAVPVSAESEPFRIAFGSCAHQAKPQPVWDAILNDQPDVFLFLGDNIYGDSESVEVLAAKYAQLGQIPGFQALRQQVPVFAIWDDHDFGLNDIGRHYSQKQASRRLLLEFFRVPADSPRWDQEGGIYAAHVMEHAGRKIQIILLDTRWDRDDLRSVSVELYENERKPARMGPYLPHTESDAQLLGDVQWLWLEQQLQQPADLRILASSIQVFSDYTGWECWANFPLEQKRLLDLLDRHRVEGAILISGDTHWAEFSCLPRDASYSLWELTSSGLTEEWSMVSPNKNRVGSTTWRANYGLIEIDWSVELPSITLSIKNAAGQLQLQNRLLLRDLSYPSETIHP